MKFDCKLCGLPLGDQPGTIPLIGEAEDAKRGRYIASALSHVLLMHAEVVSQVNQACADLGLSIVLANVSTDDEAISRTIIDLLQQVRDRLTGKDILEQAQAAAPKPKEETVLQ
jgi:hypothetical protein